MKTVTPIGFKILDGNPSFGFIFKQLFPEAETGCLCFEMGPALRSDLDDSEYEVIEKNKTPYSNYGGKFELLAFQPFLDKMRPGSDLALYFLREQPDNLRFIDGDWELAHHCYDDAWSELFTYSEDLAKRIGQVFKVSPIKFPGSINTPGGVKVPFV